MSDTKTYKTIFKSTFLFSFVQIVNIAIKLVINKIVAVLFGAEGVGLIGIYNLVVNLLKTGGGLGVYQSAVKDISESNAISPNDLANKVSLVKRIVFFCSLFGLVLTIILSPFLSKWTFGNYNHTIDFLILSFAVAFGIYSDGILAILKGLRQLLRMAKIAIVTSLVTLLVVVPFYLIFSFKGIVYSVSFVALISALITILYYKKVGLNNNNGKIDNFVIQAKPIIIMGAALMYVSFVGFLTDLYITSYLVHNCNLSTVGYYQAGVTIITSYFGIVIISMSTDYYPRISAINTNNILLKEELNKQTEVGLAIIFPLAIAFLIFSPLIIRVLYSSSFINTISYTDYAILGAIIYVCSNNLGIILLAKQKPNVFLITTTIQKLVLVMLSIFLFNEFGLKGLGVTYLIMALLHLLLMLTIMYKLYDITFNKYIYINLLLILFFSVLVLLIRDISNLYIKYVVLFFIILGSSFYSFLFLKNKLGFDIIKKVKSKF